MWLQSTLGVLWVQPAGPSDLQLSVGPSQTTRDLWEQVQEWGRMWKLRGRNCPSWQLHCLRLRLHCCGSYLLNSKELFVWVTRGENRLLLEALDHVSSLILSARSEWSLKASLWDCYQVLCKYQVLGAHGPSTVMLQIIHDVFISSSVKLGRAAVNCVRGVSLRFACWKVSLLFWSRGK